MMYSENILLKNIVPVKDRNVRFMLGGSCCALVVLLLLFDRWDLWRPRRALQPQRSSYVAKLMRLRRNGESFPRGRHAKEQMYSAFKSDVALARTARLDLRLPTRDEKQPTLRVMTFNVHFWRGSYGGDVDSNTHVNIDEILEIVQSTNADVLLLQEVAAPGLDEGQTAYVAGGDPGIDRLRKLGYRHVVVSDSPSVHRLPTDFPVYSGRLLRVAVLSRLPFRRAHSVALGRTRADGGCAFALIDLPQDGPTVGFVSTHLSVRCEPAKRKMEAEGILRALQNIQAEVSSARERVSSVAPTEDFLIGGDFNQAVEEDYSDDEWQAMAIDMKGAGIPLSDGVADAFKTAGWRRSFLEAGASPARFSAWNGSLVDFIWHNTGGKLRCVGTWELYTDASDHLPIVADYAY
jgi:endonuclease/exonuclease/phosphatase family metal-dependent hydrolase